MAVAHRVAEYQTDCGEWNVCLLKTYISAIDHDTWRLLVFTLKFKAFWFLIRFCIIYIHKNYSFIHLIIATFLPQSLIRSEGDSDLSTAALQFVYTPDCYKCWIWTFFFPFLSWHTERHKLTSSYLNKLRHIYPCSKHEEKLVLLMHLMQGCKVP